MLLGIGCLGYLAVQLGGAGPVEQGSYVLKARFLSASGLRVGASVELAGVRIGKVTSIVLDAEEYRAEIEISLPGHVRLQEDAIASIRTAGIIGDKFVKLTAGGADYLLEAGEEIIETESSINLEELISKYIFETGD